MKKFLEIDSLAYLAILCCGMALFVVGIYIGAASVVIKANQCEQQSDLIKKSAKEGVHEFLNEFGLEYRKKAK